MGRVVLRYRYLLNQGLNNIYYSTLDLLYFILHQS